MKDDEACSLSQLAYSASAICYSALLAPYTSGAVKMTTQGALTYTSCNLPWHECKFTKFLGLFSFKLVVHFTVLYHFQLPHMSSCMEVHSSNKV